MKKGLVHIYTGTGKGKTTAAFGLAIRALGSGMKVLVIQFLKGGYKSSELRTLSKIKNIKIVQLNQTSPVFWKKSVLNNKKAKEKAHQSLNKSIVKGLSYAETAITSGKFNMVILDEAVNLVSQGLVSEKKIVDLINKKPKKIELVLTGRGAWKKLINKSDYVTQMRLVKHPYKKGIKARQGIEY